MEQAPHRAFPALEAAVNEAAVRGSNAPHFLVARDLARRHGAAVALAFLVGLVTVTPALTSRLAAGVPFSSTRNITFSDELFYFARIREVLDGHPLIANPYLAEHKGKPPAPAFLGEWLLAQPLRVLGLDPVSGGVLYDFLLPAAAALLTYACLLAVTGARSLALIGTGALFFGLFREWFGRTVSPQLNMLFWLTEFLLLRALVIRGARHWGIIILAAANLGLLFYLYTYYVPFYLALMFFLGLWLFIRGEHKRAWSLAAVAAGGCALALPHLGLMYQAWRLPEYAETLRRIGLIETHFPSGVAIVVPGVLLALVFLVLVRRGLIPSGRETAFLLAGLLAAVASANQHLITGRNLEFSTHYLMSAVFWFAFALAYLAARAAPSVRRLLAPLTVALGVILIAAGALQFARAWPYLPEPGGPPGDRALPLLLWLSASAAPGSVVVAPDGISALIPIYTPLDVYFAPHAHLFFLADEELVDRFLLGRLLRGVDATAVRDGYRSFFGSYSASVAGHQAQANRVRRLVGLAPEPVERLPEAMVKRVLARARELARGDLRRELLRYRADYLVWDRATDPEAPFERLAFLEPIHDEGPFRVFRIR